MIFERGSAISIRREIHVFVKYTRTTDITPLKRLLYLLPLFSVTPVVFKLEHASETPGGLIKMACWARVSDAAQFLISLRCSPGLFAFLTSFR